MVLMTMSPSAFAISLSFPPLPLRLTAAISRRRSNGATIIVSSKTNTKTFLVKRSSASALRAVLVISCAAAVAFLRRKTRNRRHYHFQQALFQEAVPAAMSAPMQKDNRPLKVVDMHLHVWAPPEQAQKFPYAPGQEPTVLGSVEVLLQAMEEGGVDGALIVQPINHMFDHSYVSSVLQRYPDKFVGCCLADPTRGDGGVVELERLVTKEAYRAVRFNPYLWPSNEKMTNSIGRALFAKAGQLGIPVGFMCFKGLLLHIAEIELLCSEFPETTVILDHFGFCKPPIDKSEVKAWECLLGLSKLKNVYVKVSAFPRISREGYPYRDTWPIVKQLIATFGPKRLLWGSDFPFVIKECGYTNARNVMFAIKEALGMTDDDMEWVMGRTAMELFNGSWTV